MGASLRRRAELRNQQMLEMGLIQEEIQANQALIEEMQFNLESTRGRNRELQIELSQDQAKANALQDQK